MGTRRIQWASVVALSAWGAAVGCDDSGQPGTGRGRDDAPRFSGPQFPGGGTGSAAASLAAGVAAVTCDGMGPAPGGSLGPIPGATATPQCFYADDPAVPAAIIEWIVEAAVDIELVHVRLTFNPDFCDNTYGETAIGWDEAQPGGMMMPGGRPKPPKHGHTFRDLVGSDHAEFKLYDAGGGLQLHFKLDYLSESSVAPSGYATLGVTGGEGKMIAGSASDIVAASTSLDRNLNVCMLGDYLENSPATDASYTPNPAAELWDFRVVYDVWVKRESFGPLGFGLAVVDFVHASPSKAGENTIEVTPGDCPPSWPYCDNPDGCEPCPDHVCYDEPDEPDAGPQGPLF